MMTAAPVALLDLAELLDRLPLSGLGATVFHAALAAVGLVLWLGGRRLAKPVLAVGGLVVGAAALHVLAPMLGAGNLHGLIVMAGGLLGGVLAVVFFRLWMSLSMALVLAMAAPAAVLVWQGVMPPPLAQHLADAPAPVAVETANRQAPSDPAVPALVTADLTGHWQTLREAYHREQQAVIAWWQELPDATRRLMLAASALGAALGIALGLVVPQTAAAAQSALVGSLLVVFALRAILHLHLPDTLARWRVGPRTWVVLLGLITLLGVLFQWAAARRKADRS